MKTTGEINRQHKYLKSLETEYLKLLRSESNKAIHLFNEKISDLERQERYLEFRPTLDKLREPFKQIILERNKFAQMLDMDNFFMYLAVMRDFDPYRLKEYFDTVDNFIALVHSGFPSTEIFKEEKEWTMLHLPHPYGGRWFNVRFKSFDYIMDLIAKYDERVKKYRNRIKVKIVDSDYSEYDYIPKKDVVEIKLNKDVDNSEKPTTFVYELSGALEAFERLEKGEEPQPETKYKNELVADKFVFEFVKREYPERAEKIFRYNMLRKITSALFEKVIYDCDKLNFDELYASIINRCYPMANQTTNPFYLLDENLIVVPLGDLLHSIGYVELYLK